MFKIDNFTKRRHLAFVVFLIFGLFLVILNPASYHTEPTPTVINLSPGNQTALAELEQLPIKGRAPKTGYNREQFYSGWPKIDGCSLRERILKREFGQSAVLSGCNVISGHFFEPYLGQTRTFSSKSEISKGLQIDHIVALSDAWQKGAQNLSKDQRYQLATDPLNLVAADGPANMEKGDADAASWLPPNKNFRCQYVARQIAVKRKYQLWVTSAERQAMTQVLSFCINYPAVN